MHRACSGNLQCALQHWLDFGIDEGRQAMMRSALERILRQPGLSRDVTEQASKSLAG